MRPDIWKMSPEELRAYIVLIEANHRRELEVTNLAEKLAEEVGTLSRKLEEAESRCEELDDKIEEMSSTIQSLNEIIAAPHYCDSCSALIELSK